MGERTAPVDTLVQQEFALRERFYRCAKLLEPAEKGYVVMDWVNGYIDSTLLEYAANNLSTQVRDKNLNIKSVVPVPTMGTYLGGQVATNLALPIAPARKDGKTPGSWHDVVVMDSSFRSFTTESSNATFIFHGLEEGDRILLVDDVIAWGDTTINIASRLWEERKVVVVGVAAYAAKLFQGGVKRLEQNNIKCFYVYGIEIDENQKLTLSPSNLTSIDY